MVEACASYAETGSRQEAFGGWHVASTGGGVCNGAAACEDDEMTFIAPAPLGAGAVTVSVGAADRFGPRPRSAETAVGDRPAHMTCRSAADTAHGTAQVRGTQLAWAEGALASRRVIEAGLFADTASGPYLGCAYDGRSYQIEVAHFESGEAVLRVYLPAREGAPEGAMPDCGSLLGRGMTDDRPGGSNA
jgi:hypothetical protein